MDSLERTKIFRTLMDQKLLKAADVAKMFGLTTATVRAWRYGKYAIPENKFKMFVKSLNR